MVVLQNDVQVAGDRATSLANGVQALSSSGTVMTDAQTRLGGNEEAKKVIAKSQELSFRIGSVLTAMSQNIQSVSSSFQAMDTELGNQLKSTGFSLNDPE